MDILDNVGTPTEETGTESKDNAAALSEQGTAPQEPEQNGTNQGNPSSETGTSAPQDPPAPFLTVKYCHQDRDLSQEEAVTLAQKGLAYDSIYEPIQRVAALKGMEVKQFIESLETEQDEAHRAELAEKYGDDSDTVNQLMELYRTQKENTVKEAKNRAEQARKDEKTTLETRLAEEFKELKAEFPEIKDFPSLPQSVKNEAAAGRDLLSAYLRFTHSEAKKAASAADTAARAASGSTGPLQSVGNKSNTIDALMQGLYG